VIIFLNREGFWIAPLLLGAMLITMLCWPAEAKAS
jgi:hypothetical protein